MNTAEILRFRSTYKWDNRRPSFFNELTDSQSSSYFAESKVEISTEFTDHLEAAKKWLEENDLIAKSKLHNEIAWFYSKMGLDRYYFLHTPPEVAARHIVSLYASKVLATSSGARMKFDLHYEQDDSAFFGVDSYPDRISPGVVAVEYKIEEEYLGEGYVGIATPRFCRLQVFRTKEPICQRSGTFLRLYFIEDPQFVNPNPAPGETSIDQIADKRFLENVGAETKEFFQDLVLRAKNSMGPIVVERPILNPIEGEMFRIIIAYQTGSVHSFFSALTDLYNSHGFQSSRKYVEQFSNGVTTITLYLTPVDTSLNREDAHEFLKEVIAETSLVYVLPRTSLTPLFHENILTAPECAYAYAAWKFAYYFMSYSQDLAVDGGLSEMGIKSAIEAYPSLVQELYQHFLERFHVEDSDGVDVPKADPSRLSDGAHIKSLISRTASTQFEVHVFNCILCFNLHVLKTNFFKPSKVALSFRLNPAFMANFDEYPMTPFAIFFLVGSEFRGFHVRFRDVARGGIRIIRSAHPEAWLRNLKSLFKENYNLANTQERKNKDIPEGGSKGTILLSPEHQDKADVAFRKYVDGLLDLLLRNKSIIDYYEKEELLFLGPDEGTADLMDWAALHAKSRGATFWKGFTTGKSRSLGGIPHDLYGMTTRSVHQYVLGIYTKRGLNEESVFKLQTGGPDGDLGSNEIKISKDKTKAIVDGSGVLYDPEGINRDEILRLAQARQMVSNFDKSKLSPNGFLVLITDKDVKLPDGTLVESGLMFRNNFHVNPLGFCELFVPCGGRPEAINKNNVHCLINPDTKRAAFNYIVEGANLFLTQDARMELEKAGVLIFKDASANKGGVTSSSLEVLAALSLTDSEYAELMQVKGDKVPHFYEEYVRCVHTIIERNAAGEFNCLWREHERTGKPLSILSDECSNKINELSTSIAESALWEDKVLRERVIYGALPANLLKTVPLDVIVRRLPPAYIKALFSSSLAADFIYTYGLDPPSYAFYEYVMRKTERVSL